MDGKLISTMIDKLAERVYVAGEISSAQASQDLDIPRKQVEEWAAILEEHEIVSLKYSPIQGMILKAKPLSPAELKKKLEELEKEKARIESIAEGLIGDVEKFHSDAPELEKSFGLLETQIRREIENANRALSSLSDLEKIKDSFEKDVRRVETAEDRASKTRKELDKKIMLLRTEFKVSKQKVKDVSSRLLRANKIISTFEKELSGAAKDRKTLEKAVGEFKEELKELESRSKHIKPEPRAIGDLYSAMTRVEQHAKKIREKHDASANKLIDLKSRLAKALRIIRKK